VVADVSDRYQSSEIYDCDGRSTCDGFCLTLYGGKDCE
jgi:hypothetical protein